MPGLVPGIRDLNADTWKTWMAGTSPAMTGQVLSILVYSSHQGRESVVSEVSGAGWAASPADVSGATADGSPPIARDGNRAAAKSAPNPGAFPPRPHSAH